MNFFTYETQVSRGLRLIGRSNTGRKKAEATLHDFLLSSSKSAVSSRRRSLPSPSPRQRRGCAPERGSTIRVSSAERGCTDSTASSSVCPAKSADSNDPAVGDSRSNHRSCGDLGARPDDHEVAEERRREEAMKEVMQVLAFEVAEARRREEAMKEVMRVLAFERSTFPSIVDWAFAVLGVSVTEHTLTSVQRCYRALMKKLHPDKAAQSRPVVETVEIIQEAKAICERSLCRHEVPGAPRELSVVARCLKAGQRRLLLRWMAPERQEQGPVQRYIVAAADPSGASQLPIRLSTLEPDYSQELGRYITLDELGTFELTEEESGHRVPGLFQQTSLTLMVAAASKVGQSRWAAVTVDLTVSCEVAPRTCCSSCVLQDASRATSPPPPSTRRCVGGQSSARVPPRCSSPGPVMAHVMATGPTTSPSPVVRRAALLSAAPTCIGAPQHHGICATEWNLRGRLNPFNGIAATASGPPAGIVRFRTVA